MTDRSTRITAVLAAIVAVLAVVAMLVTSYASRSDPTGQAASDESGERVGGQPAPAGPGSGDGQGEGDGSTEQPPDEGGDPKHVPEAPDPETIKKIRQTAKGFLQAWKKPGSPKERREAIGPYATNSLTDQLAQVHADNLPSGDLQGKLEVEGGVYTTATAEGSFADGPRVRCDLLLTPDGWAVSRLLPVDDDQGKGQQGGSQQDKSQQGEGQQDKDQQGKSQGQQDRPTGGN